MRKYFKYVSSIILVPLTKWYLRKNRTYKIDGIPIQVNPGVFHPGLFSSTQHLLNYLKLQSLRNNTLLELGCGTALLSIWASTRGSAVVTASDISSLAIANAKLNAQANHADIEILRSDLFDDIPPQHFDWIIVNPPYYPRSPRNEADFAWFCGENFEYFTKFFSQLGSYTQATSVVLMVLTKGCDLDTIKKIAQQNNYALVVRAEKSVVFDGADYIFQVEQLTRPSQ